MPAHCGDQRHEAQVPVRGRKGLLWGMEVTERRRRRPALTPQQELEVVEDDVEELATRASARPAAAQKAQFVACPTSAKTAVDSLLRWGWCWATL